LARQPADNMGKYSKGKYNELLAYIEAVRKMYNRLKEKYDYKQRLDKSLGILEVYSQKAKEIGLTVALLLKRRRYSDSIC